MAPKFELKVPKGTKDREGVEMVIRTQIFDKVSAIFKKHGGVTIDTPTFELKSILSGKYGEDSKLIYDLADQGGEECALRYDLTVPFARFLAMNKDIRTMKRYAIAKVFRRDQPAMAKGRMREFYQCDFDIAGEYDRMVPDAEIIQIVREIFASLGLPFTVKLNHRKILDGLFQVCGVPEDKLRAISSAVDKLDKQPWAEVRAEMVDQKGLDPEVADRIGEYVVLKADAAAPGSNRALLERLKADDRLTANDNMRHGLEDLDLMFNYLDWFGALDVVSFDLSLARGLDYYTGVIFECVTEGSAPAAATSTDGSKPSGAKPKKKGGNKDKDGDEDRSDDPTVGVGSIAAGGRYDNLVGMFAGKGQIPCVGISFGVERIASLIQAKLVADNAIDKVRKNDVDCYVMAFGGKDFDGMLKERMQVISRLWAAGIKAEFLYKVKAKLQNQFKAAEANGVPFAVILGADEWAAGQIKVKEMGLPENHPEKEGVAVPLADLEAAIAGRVRRHREIDDVTARAGGLHVVDGVKAEDVDTTAA